jgi:hypothetical protein
MARPCEICQSLEREPGAGKVRRFIVDERIVALCEEHARELGDAIPETVDELRERFIEPEGRRSLLSRRSPLDRRVFPPRPEGRRRAEGRRAKDGPPSP